MSSKTNGSPVSPSTVLSVFCLLLYSAGFIRIELKFNDHDQRLVAVEEVISKLKQGMADTSIKEISALRPDKKKEADSEAKIHRITRSTYSNPSTNFSANMKEVLEDVVTSSFKKICRNGGRLNICPRGKPGPPGRRGRKGSQGIMGPPGRSGKPGIAGPPGIRGEKGIKGDFGPSGIPGIKGNFGEPGIQGIKGDNGPRGIPGIKGVTGPPGIPGIKGDTGPPGIPGIKGNLGEPGFPGNKGDIGPRGIQGIKGVAGPQGTRGIKGDVGPRGIPGIKGDIGPDGIQGIKGDIGPRGITGIKGDIGQPGIQGIKGDVGPPGSLGKTVCGPVGVKDRNAIPDARMTASSYYNNYYYPYYGRLHENRRHGAWCPKTTSDRTDYLQVDMGTVHTVCALLTQGGKNSGERSTSYKVRMSTDGITWNVYKENNVEKVFPGNRVDKGSTLKHPLSTYVKGRFVRFYPVTYKAWPCMRVEVFVLK